MPKHHRSNALFRIRFHGRGGQGVKTASRILGQAFFLAGYEVQDAPRYGAERRGATIFAYVRASHDSIYERGIIRRPDLVVVADETLVEIPAAGVLQGVTKTTVVLIHSKLTAEDWIKRYTPLEKVVILHPVKTRRQELHLDSAACAGAAACLAGVITRDHLQRAIEEEFVGQKGSLVQANLTQALDAYNQMALDSGLVIAGSGDQGTTPASPDWIDLPFEAADISAPTIHAALTSTQVTTGLWRTLRPVVDENICRRCGLCSSYCPEGVISLDDQGIPVIDYVHCKGCLVCVVECPAHAIHAHPEPVPEGEQT